MVRLKVEYLALCDALGRFQFHYGTIKSLSPTNSFFSPHYFNSTMVRLKENLPQSSIHSRPHFNSTMVRLKEKNMIESGGC